VHQEALGQIGVDLREVQQGLALAALEGLRASGITGLEVHPRSDDSFLRDLCAAMGRRPASAQVGPAADYLRARLKASAPAPKAGLEESPSDGEKEDAGSLENPLLNALKRASELLGRWEDLTLFQRFRVIGAIESLAGKVPAEIAAAWDFAGNVSQFKTQLEEANPSGWTELVRGDPDSTIPAAEIRSVTGVDRRAVGTAYLFSSKPSLAQLRGLLDSRQQEFGVKALVANGRPRVAVVVGKERSVDYGHLQGDLYRMWDQVAVGVSLHNHPRGSAFPSRKDFDNLEYNLEKWPEALEGQRNFVYQSGSYGRGIFEYGVRKGESVPGRIQVRTWRRVPVLGKKSESDPDEVEYLENTFGWHLTEIGNPPSDYIYTPPLQSLSERFSSSGPLRVEITDGKRWAAWDSRVSLETLLGDFMRRPPRRAPTAGLEERVDLSDYEVVGEGDQSIIYRIPGEGSSIRLFRGSEVRNEDVLRYLQIAGSLPAVSTYPPRPVEIRIPGMEAVTVIGRPSGREIGIRSDFVEGMSLKAFLDGFLTPGERWWTRLYRPSADPQREILEQIRRAVASQTTNPIPWSRLDNIKGVRRT